MMARMYTDRVGRKILEGRIGIDSIKKEIEIFTDVGTGLHPINFVQIILTRVKLINLTSSNSA